MYQILTWSATCCMWRVETVSKWEDKKNLLLCRVQKKTHGKPWLCRVSKKTHGKVFLCRVLKKAHGKPWLCRVLWFCRVFSWAHSAKIMFDVCPWICTRQTMVHTAKSKFPVVKPQQKSDVLHKFLNKMSGQIWGWKNQTTLATSQTHIQAASGTDISNLFIHQTETMISMTRPFTYKNACAPYASRTIL